MDRPSSRRLRSRVAAAGLAGLLLVACGAEPAPPPQPVRSFSLFSDVYPVDQIYRSMKGPFGIKRFQFSRGKPELVWITGFKAEIVGGDADELVSDEFMCHSNLDFIDSRTHSKQLRGQQAKTNDRLFTLSQGQMDVVFPKGFGIPVLSNEKFALTTQVLNLNEQERSFDVRHKTTIQYVRAREATSPMTALYQMPLQTLVLLEGVDGLVGMPHGSDDPTASCSVGIPARDRVIEDDYGRKLSAHWVVEPGRHVFRTPADAMMNIPGKSTQVHFIAVHLHPFAETLELRDRTTGETFYKSRARNREDQIGLRHVDSFVSEEGIEIFADHRYELVATYDNTSGVPQDSMAVMFLYAADPAYQPPVLASRTGAD